MPASELVGLCALDQSLYCRTFFPRAFRQASPVFHRDIWELLEDQTHRYVAIEVFRDGAKTTLLRAYTSKRIAYGNSRTILVVGKAQDHAKFTIAWLKKQVEFNTQWASVFGLEKGSKWSDEHIEIIHKPLGVTISVLAYGVTGQIRGVNLDDSRPDLIIIDDPCDSENTATEVQRNKMEEQIAGALEPALVPETDVPDSKMVLLQTPLAKGDAIDKRSRNPLWAFRRYSIFDDNGESRWPARYPTSTLLKWKQSYIDQNQLDIWLRERECTLTDPALYKFKTEWLQYWDVLPDGMAVYMGVDPVPPPSEAELAGGLAEKDFEAFVVWGTHRGNRYLLDYAQHKGHEPDWTIATFFRLLDRWKPIRVRVEGIAYQRVLKWLFEQEMSKRKRWVQVNAASDKRSKRHRIIQAHLGLASNKRLFIHRSHVDFYEQFATYDQITHEDLLDASAMALDEASSYPVDSEYVDSLPSEEEDEPVLAGWRRAP